MRNTGKHFQFGKWGRGVARRTYQLQRASSHFNWAIADQTVVSGANFATSILLARMLGAEEFGKYVLVWMLVVFIQTLQNSAINAAMQSIGPKHEQAAAAKYYSHMFLQQGVFGITTALVFWIGIHVFTILSPDWDLGALALPGAAAVLFCQTQEFLRRYLFSIQCQRIGFLIDFVRYISPMGLLVTYDQYGPGDINVTVALWINAFAAGVAMVCASPFVPRLRWGGSLLWRASRSSWQFSKWLVAASILAWAMGNLYYVVTSILLGPAAVGILRAAQSLLGVLNIFFLGIENVLPVQSSRKFTEGGITALNVYLKRAAVLGGVVTTIVAGFFAIAPQFWLDLLFGKSYGSGGALVQWMALGNIVLYFTVPAMVWLRTVEQTRHIFHAYLASAVVSAVVAYPAILYFGLRGAAIGILISAVVNFATLAISIRYAWRKIVDQNANDRKRVEIYPMNLSSQ